MQVIYRDPELMMWFQLSSDAVLLGSQDRDDYDLIAPLPSYGRGREDKPGFTARYHPLVFAVKANNVAVTGMCLPGCMV